MFRVGTRVGEHFEQEDMRQERFFLNLELSEDRRLSHAIKFLNYSKTIGRV